MRLFKAAWDYVVLAIGIALLATLCAVWGLASVVLNVALPASAGRKVGRRCASWIFRSYLAVMEALGAWRLDLAALDELPRDEALILAPNHPCLLDAVLVVSRVPDALCVMKSALVANFLLGPAAKLARYVRNDSLRVLITRVNAELSHGGKLLLFPEGTRSADASIGPFTDAVGALSRSSGVPVQAVIIESDSAFLGKGWPVLRRPELPLTYRVRLGRRFEPPSDVRAFTRELQKYFERELTSRSAVPVPGHASVVEDAPQARG